MSRRWTVISGIALCVVAGWMLHVADTLPDTTFLPPSPISNFNGATAEPTEIPTSVMPVIFGGVLIWFSTLARERRERSGGTPAMESLLLGLGLAIVGVFLPFYFLRLLS